MHICQNGSHQIRHSQLIPYTNRSNRGLSTSRYLLRCTGVESQMHERTSAFGSRGAAKQGPRRERPSAAAGCKAAMGAKGCRPPPGELWRLDGSRGPDDTQRGQLVRTVGRLT